MPPNNDPISRINHQQWLFFHFNLQDSEEHASLVWNDVALLRKSLFLLIAAPRSLKPFNLLPTENISFSLSVLYGKIPLSLSSPIHLLTSILEFKKLPKRWLGLVVVSQDVWPSYHCSFLSLISSSWQLIPGQQNIVSSFSSSLLQIKIVWPAHWSPF